MRKGKLRFAVVGLGKMGLVHAGILNVLSDVQVVAICERSGLVRRFAKKMFKTIQIVDDVEKLAELNLDAVYVTTPIPSHFSVAKAVFNDRIAGNVFVEKTLAQSYEQAKQLSELARSLGGVNMVGYLRRFYVTFNKARDLLMKEAIGKVTSFKAYAYSSDFVGTDEKTRTSAARGGVLRDLGCHALDLALWFFGDMKITPSGTAQTNDHFEDFLSFKAENSEVQGQFDVSWFMEDYRLPEVGFSITGSKGELVVNDDQVRLSLRNGESSRWYRHDLGDNVHFWLALPEYYREDIHFVESIIEGKSAEPDFSAGSKVDKMIDDVETKVGEGN